MIKNKLVKKIMSFLLFTVFIFQMVFYPSTAKADETDNGNENNNSQVIDKAIEWLDSKQENEGYWGSSEFVNDTCDVLRLYNNVGAGKDGGNAYSWLENKNYRADNDSLSRYIAINPDKYSSICKELINKQNNDGGFGVTSDYTSDVWDSLLVLEALENTGDTYENQVLAIISYLLSMQNEDGGFGYNLKSGSDTVITARIADAIYNYCFSNFLQSENVTNALKKVNRYLENVNYLDISSDNFEQSIYAYEYLFDSVSLENSLEFIGNIAQVQNEDGSFFGDVHDTCLVAELIHKTNTRLAMKTEVKGFNITSNVASVYTYNETEVNIKADISYYTNYDKNYKLVTKVYDGETVTQSNIIDIPLKSNMNTVSGSAISFVVNESKSKDITVKSVLQDEQGNTVKEASQIITVNDKLIDHDVLLIQTVRPWSSDTNEVVLRQLGISYVKMTAEQVLNVDLLKYRVIIVANDQTNSVYRDIAKLKVKLESFVNNGGTLLYGVCDGGWSDGTSDVYIPGNIEVARYYSYNDYIVDEDHPIVKALYSDKIPLVNGDLYNNWCSHTYLKKESLPKETNIIFNAGEDYPTLVEYNIGKGLVIASCLTWEHGYTHDRKFALKALDDLFLYALHAAKSAIDDKPGTVTSTVTTDKTAYNTSDEIKIHVKNELSSFRRQVNGVLSVTDIHGKIVEKLYTDINKNMTVGIPIEDDYTWKVKDILAGSYKINIEWYDKGKQVGGGETVFKVLADKKLINKVEVNNKEVNADTSINITDIIKNQSNNSVEDNLMVVFMIYDKDGKEVANCKDTIDQLLQGNQKNINKTIDLLDWKEGDYTIVSTVYKENEIQCSSNTTFRIIKTDKTELKLSGDIKVNEGSEKEIKNLTYSIKNNNKKPVSNLNAIVTIIDSATNTEVYSATRSAINLEAVSAVTGSAISVTGSAIEFNDPLYTAALKPGGYIAVLSVSTNGGERIVLDADYFIVEERIPSYFITGYSLFSSQKDITINCSQSLINNEVFSNNNFTFNGSILKIKDKCSAVSKINTSGWILDIPQKLQNAGFRVPPDFTTELLRNMQKKQGLSKVEKVIYYNSGEITQPTECNTAEFYCPNISINQELVSNKNVIFNCNKIDIGGEEQTVVCSLDGDVVINASTVNVNGFIYAPNGTVYINASTCNISGTIIAKEIKLQGSYFNINQ